MFGILSLVVIPIYSNTQNLNNKSQQGQTRSGFVLHSSNYSIEKLVHVNSYHEGMKSFTNVESSFERLVYEL